MSRTPISRAITNVASDMRRRGGFYIPTDYLNMINKDNIINAYKSGVKLQTAVRRELMKFAVKNPTVTIATGEVITGEKAATLIADVNEWNRKLRLYMDKHKDYFMKDIYEIDISEIENLDAVLRVIHGRTPLDEITRRHDITLSHIKKSFEEANLPDVIKDALMEKINSLSPSALNSKLYYLPSLQEFFGSDEQTFKMHIDEYLKAFGIPKVETDKGGNETPTEVGKALNKWMGFKTYKS